MSESKPIDADVLGAARGLNLRLAMQFMKGNTEVSMLIAEVILDERERCARIADEHSDETAQAIAKAIRA